MLRSGFPPPAALLLRRGIQPERISFLNREPVRRGAYVLYWMQASQRARCNHALEYAVLCANALALPLAVCFGLTPAYPEANLRHYAFMLEGLSDVAAALRRRGIAFALELAEPPRLGVRLSREAALVVTDLGYTATQIAWRLEAAREAKCLLVQVESDAVVPVETASDREEYAARTLRPKLLRQIEKFLQPLPHNRPRRDGLALHLGGEDASDPALLRRLQPNAAVQPSPLFRGGEREARRRLRKFLDSGLPRYGERNDPTAQATSRLSPYLHFGQIGALEIALAVRERGGAAAADFLEQLLVRRELALNFVYYNQDYDNYRCVPDWARKSLARCAKDKREALYAADELERAVTHDPAWNAAQSELAHTGHMSGYMRMYWGKRIIEWSPTPEAAYAVALRLNHKYELDGRDPCGFAGVAWCFGKHDRPWQPRLVLGNVRYMNFNGLKRKFDLAAYIAANPAERCRM